MTAAPASASASAPAAPDAWARFERWPGVRTLRSRRFRLAIGVSLWFVGLVVLGTLLVGLANDPGGQFGIDFADYRTASLRMLEGRSPYAPEMLSGPIAAQGVDRYRYPPPFAQVLTPIAVLPFEAGASVWLVIQGVLLFGAAWIAASAAGARPSLDRVVWTGVALTYFLPAFDTLWKGNVEAPMVFSVGLLLAVGASRARGEAATLGAGALAGAVAVLKLVPAAVLPAALRRGRPLAAGVLLGVGLFVLPSFLLAPQAWLDYGRVLPNLLAGDARYANNLAPAIVALNLGSPAAVADLIRIATLALAVVLVVVSAWLAGRADPQGGSGAWPAAVAAGVVASLLLPAALWYHYLTLLVPLAAFVWVRAPRLFVRAGLLGSGAAVTMGLAFLPLAAVGGAWLGGTVLVALWPRRR